LNVEQCSSETTAFYKASLAREICGNDAAVWDLTGGLGVDSWAFALTGFKVHYNEMDHELAGIVADNFSSLGAGDIICTSVEIDEDSVMEALLKASDNDLVYMDPARRDAAGGKVYRMEDCKPDVMKLKDRIFSRCRNILVKLSPMIDISGTAALLGRQVREIHVIGSSGECKEVLVRLDREWDSGYSVTAVEGDERFTFTPGEEKEAVPSFAESPEDLKGMNLYEPGSALLKSGAFKLIGNRMGLKKLAVSTHLYVGSGQGRRITEILPYNGRNVRELGKRYPVCELTARNIPTSSDALRKKMGVKSGGDVHIYAVTCDFSDSPSRKMLLVTSG
ncbi:MAG: hypothetical protein MJY45_06965, partial [Bacteroidales bacterium]|nr:hypothetical protein [Bacteroidales bacterium]